MFRKIQSFSLRIINHEMRIVDGYRFHEGVTQRKSSKVLLPFKRHLSVLNRRNVSEDYSIDMKELMNTFSTIVNEFKSDIPEVENSFKNTLKHFLPKGERARALTLMRIYKNLEEPENLTPENIKLANILGWFIEMLFYHAIILDDIMDGSQIRRGGLCLHKREDVGMRAVFDALLLENYLYQLAKNHFSHLPTYVPMIELLRESHAILAIGQISDSLTQNSDISNFTRERYHITATYKTRPTGFELPYILASRLSNKYDAKLLSDNDELITKLNTFYQAQNDFLDVYNEPSPELKTGNDIIEGKCSWLIVVALEKANSEQRFLLRTHYGKKSPESAKVVKGLYNVLEVAKAYATYEEETFDLINKNIEEVRKITCPEIMFKRLHNYYKKYI